MISKTPMPAPSSALARQRDRRNEIVWNWQREGYHRQRRDDQRAIRDDATMSEMWRNWPTMSVARMTPTAAALKIAP